MHRDAASKHDIREANEACREHGYRAAHATAPYAGVSILVKQPLQFVELDPPDNLIPWKASGRMVAVQIFTEVGDLVAVVIATYAPARHLARQHDKEEVGKMWQNVLEWLHRMGRIPCIIGGDFNAHWQDEEPLDTAVNDGTLLDPFQIFESIERKATFKTGSILDHMLVTADLLPSIRTAATSNVPGPADHMTTQIEVQLGPSTADNWPRLRYAKPLPPEVAKPVLGELDGVSKEADSAFKKALDRRDVNGALAAWSQCWESFLIRRCQHHGCEVPADCQGRAAPPVTQGTPVRSSMQGHRLTHHGRALRNLQRDLTSYQQGLHQAQSNDADVANCLIQRGQRLGVTYDYQLENPDWVESYQMLLDLEIFEHEKKMAEVRAQLWRESFSRHSDPHFAKAYRFVKAIVARTLKAVKTGTGITTKIEDLDKLLRHTWMSVCLPKDRDVEQCRQAFVDMDNAEPQPECPLPPLRPTDLQRIVKHVANGKSPGYSSWRPTDLKRLPLLAFEQLCQLFELCEAQACYPDELKKALVSYIPKDADPAPTPDRVRPISVLPLVMRIYLSLRAEHLTAILDPQMLPQQWGGRPAKGVTQPLIYTDTLVDLATKRLCGPVFLAQLDITKFFNNIDPVPLLPALNRAGVPVHFTRALAELYQGLLYMNKYHSGLIGPAWKPCRGIPQGDPCAVILANWYMRVIIHHANVEHLHTDDPHLQEFPGCHVFLDDVTIADTTAEGLKLKLQRLVRAMRMVGLQVNLKKSAWLAAGVAMDDEQIIVEDQLLPRVNCVTLLGVDMGQPDHDQCTKFSARLATCNQRLSRITRLPISEAVRSMLVANTAVAPLLYVPIGAWTPQGGQWQRRIACTIKRCRAQDWAMETSAEIFWHCLHRGHRLHFPWARWYAVVRLVATAHEWCGEAVRMLLAQAEPIKQPRSAVDILVSLNSELGVTLDATGHLIAEDSRFCLIRGRRSWSEYTHELRAFVKISLSRRLARRRPHEFDGLDTGFDRQRTVQGITALEKEGRVIEAAVARKWICGALRSRDRHVRHSRIAAPVFCARCGTRDTLHHILWECPRWSQYRKWATSQQLPTCLSTTGVVPNQWVEQGRWLKQYLKQAPKLLYEYMKWVKNAPEDSWTWGDAELEHQHNVKPDTVSRDDLTKKLLTQVRRRLRRKQPPPPAFCPQSIQELNGHLLRVAGRLTSACRDRGVPVMLTCGRCRIRKSYTRRSWYAQNACGHDKMNRPSKRRGKWHDAVLPLMSDWEISWKHWRPVLTCKKCAATLRPMQVAHLQPKVAEHAC